MMTSFSWEDEPAGIMRVRTFAAPAGIPQDGLQYQMSFRAGRPIPHGVGFRVRMASFPFVVTKGRGYPCPCPESLMTLPCIQIQTRPRLLPEPW